MPGPEKTYQDKLAQGSFEIQRCAGSSWWSKRCDNCAGKAARAR
jgi:hypothetical protein